MPLTRALAMAAVLVTTTVSNPPVEAADYREMPIQVATPDEAAFAAMEAKVALLERPGALQPRRASQWHRRLLAGEVQSRTWTAANGDIGEWTEGLVDVPLERFLVRVPAAAWGRHLRGNLGGELRDLGEGRQVERMLIASPGTDLDMTKMETVRAERDALGRLAAAVVRWEVFHSDNGTVLRDVGSVRFERHGRRTRVVFHSLHRLAHFAWLRRLFPRALLDLFTAQGLAASFRGFVRHYGDLATAAGCASPGEAQTR